MLRFSTSYFCWKDMILVDVYFLGVKIQTPNTFQKIIEKRKLEITVFDQLVFLFYE